MANPQSRPIGQTLQQEQTADKEITRVRHLLSNVVAQQGGRYYKTVYSFTIRFEIDDTSAVRDTQHFKDMILILGFPPPREIVLPKVDPFPTYSLETILSSLMKKIMQEDERSLIIGHYAGHAGLDSIDKLVFFGTASSRAKLHHYNFFKPL